MASKQTQYTYKTIPTSHQAPNSLQPREINHNQTSKFCIKYKKTAKVFRVGIHFQNTIVQLRSPESETNLTLNFHRYRVYPSTSTGNAKPFNQLLNEVLYSKIIWVHLTPVSLITHSWEVGGWR